MVTSSYHWTVFNKTALRSSFRLMNVRVGKGLVNHCAHLVLAQMMLALVTLPCLTKQELWAWLYSVLCSLCTEVKLEQPQGCCLTLWDQYSPQQCPTEQHSAAVPREVGEMQETSYWGNVKDFSEVVEVSSFSFWASPVSLTCSRKARALAVEL